MTLTHFPPQGERDGIWIYQDGAVRRDMKQDSGGEGAGVR